MSDSKQLPMSLKILNIAKTKKYDICLQVDKKRCDQKYKEGDLVCFGKYIGENPSFQDAAVITKVEENELNYNIYAVFMKPDHPDYPTVRRVK